ncbi:ATP-binding cassette sub- G member 2 [Blyttiomyces sp. JEL0837]|nr:ATP-binding cassette sub- G member 2 [Blyttiomyces sp. JEL0837]
MDKKESEGPSTTTVEIESTSRSGYILTWDHIQCTLNTKGGMMATPKTIVALDEVSGFARPGEALAILGASGAGKTTLMDILAKRKTFGTINGKVLINGRTPDEFYEKRLGYVTYDMSHTPSLTVRETLLFAAEMRMPASSTAQERLDMVEKQIKGLKLTGCADTVVGDELLRGVSSGEKKRLEVAIELVASPKIIFLDEPTSGLDDHGARFTMDLVLEHAKKQNITVVVVIHQPSKTVIELFDRVMILGAGKVCFFGRYTQAEQYFTTALQAPTPEFTNPIEHYVDVISEDAAHAAKVYSESELAKEMEIERNELMKADQADVVRHSQRIIERSFIDQFTLLVKRVVQRYHRNFSTSYGRIIVSIFIAIIYGALFYKVESDIPGIRNRGSLASVMAFIPAFVAGSAAPQFLEDRDLFIQETKAAFYTTPAYYLSYFLIESALIVAISTVQALILFFMAGIDNSALGAFVTMIMVQGVVSVAVTQFTGAICKTLVQTYTVLVSYGLVLYIFSGVQVNLNQLGSGFSWITYIDYWTYSVQFLLYRTVQNVQVDCGASTIALNMNLVLPTLRDTVIGTVINSTVLDSTNATQVSTVVKNVGAISTLSTFASTFLPKAQGLDDAMMGTIGAQIQQDVGFFVRGLVGNVNATLNISNPEVLKGLATNYGAVSLWNGTRGLTDAKVFPDYSYCAIFDAATFIHTHFGVGPSAGDNNRYGIMIGWMFFYMALTYISLEFSKTYKKR